MTHWTERYLGIPYAEMNCWALVCHVYEREFGVLLPRYEEHYSIIEDTPDLARIYAEERRASHAWSKVERGSEVIGDVIGLWFTRPGYMTHVGIALGDGRRMLHTRRKTGSVVESYEPGTVWGRRVVGISRHTSLLGARPRVPEPIQQQG